MRFIYIVLFVIFYFMFKGILSNYFPYNNFLSSVETFNNLSENIFLDNNSKYGEYQIKKLTKYSETFNPILLTDYKFSETYKLGYELSKFIPMEIEESNGMYGNLKKLKEIGNSYQMAFCTENDYYKSLDEKIFTKDEVRFVCSFYRMEFILILNAKYKINTYSELKNIINLKSSGEKSKYLNFGILNNNNSSYYDGQNILNLLGFDKNTKGINILDNYPTMRHLIDSFDRDELDMIYLTTTSKNPYLINYIKTNFINIIGTDGINDDLIKTKFHYVFKENINIGKYNRIVEDNTDLFARSNSNNDKGKKTNINSYSTRLILVAKRDLPEEYILKLLRNIYGNIPELKKKMNDYFFNERNNTLIKSFDPREMSFARKNISYHAGARTFYEEIKFITYDESANRTYHSNINSKLLSQIENSEELMSINSV